jgi:transposase
VGAHPARPCCPGGSLRRTRRGEQDEANKTIRALIILAGVICWDETPLRAGPGPKIRKKYLQVAGTNLLTCYYLGDRDLAAFKDFICSDLHGAVVVHDRYQNYDAFDQANAAWQQGLRAGPAKTTAEYLKLFRHGIAAGLSQVRRVPAAKSKQPPARPNATCGHQRPSSQKISGRLGSEKTTRDRYAISGYASTAAKHEIAVFTAIRDALTGNPWMPTHPGQRLNHARNPSRTAT